MKILEGLKSIFQKREEDKRTAEQKRLADYCQLLDLIETGKARDPAKVAAELDRLQKTPQDVERDLPRWTVRKEGLANLAKVARLNEIEAECRTEAQKLTDEIQVLRQRFEAEVGKLAEARSEWLGQASEASAVAYGWQNRARPVLEATRDLDPTEANPPAPPPVTDDSPIRYSSRTEPYVPERLTREEMQNLAEKVLAGDPEAIREANRRFSDDMPSDHTVNYRQVLHDSKCRKNAAVAIADAEQLEAAAASLEDQAEACEDTREKSALMLQASMKRDHAARRRGDAGRATDLIGQPVSGSYGVGAMVERAGH